MQTITLYTRPACPYCERAKAFFASLQLPFESIDIGSNVDLARQVVARSGQMTVPQIFIGERSIGGYTDMVDLHSRGEFLPLLEVQQ